MTTPESLQLESLPYAVLPAVAVQTFDAADSSVPRGLGSFDNWVHGRVERRPFVDPSKRGPVRGQDRDGFSLEFLGLIPLQVLVIVLDCLLTLSNEQVLLLILALK